MTSISGVYNAVPLRLIGGGSIPVRRELAAPGATTFSSPPPPTISPRLVRVWLLSVVALGLLIEAAGIYWS